MPLLFDFNASFKSHGECDYMWNIDKTNFLYLSPSPGAQFQLEPADNGHDLYVISAASTGKYLATAKDSATGKLKISATSNKSGALQLRAEPTTTEGNDPFAWVDPQSGDYLRVATDHDNYIFLDGESIGDVDCQFTAIGSLNGVIAP